MAILAFQKPDKIILQKATDFEGTFDQSAISPLKRAYSHSLGRLGPLRIEVFKGD